MPSRETRARREDQLDRLVEQHTLHGVLHALVEVAYRRVGRYEVTTQEFRRADAWRAMARAIAALEDIASRFTL